MRAHDDLPRVCASAAGRDRPEGSAILPFAEPSAGSGTFPSLTCPVPIRPGWGTIDEMARLDSLLALGALPVSRSSAPGPAPISDLYRAGENCLGRQIRLR